MLGFAEGVIGPPMSNGQGRGPTDIRHVGETLHVDGYPDAAQLAVLNTKLGHRLADLRMHQGALGQCEVAMQSYGSLKNQLDPATAHVLLTGIVATFFSCFGRNEASLTLSANKAFRGQKNAKLAFDFWKDIRNKLFIHNEGGYDALISAVVLGHKSEVQDILSMQLTADVTDDANIKNLYALIVHARKFVTTEIDSLLPRVFDEARAMTPGQRAALPDAKYTVPTVADASKTRTR